MRVIESNGDFKILKTCRDYVLVNKREEYERHSHFKTEQGARNCLDLINKNLMPKSKYMQVACKRLLGNIEYNKLVERKKEKYININKGVKR